MPGFKIAIRNYREKKDPSGRVTLAKITPKIPGQPRAVLEARANRQEAQLRKQAAEHYTPIPREETK